MAWTGPTTRATGDLITASIWNTDLVNNLLYLHGDAGAISLANAIYVAGPGVAGGASLLLKNGDTGASANTTTQIRFGYANSDQYQHYLVTRHTGGGTTNNAIDLWTSDGTAAGVFPTNAVLGLSINAGLATGSLRDNSGGTMRVHRHPYGDARHIESGSVNFTGTSSVSFTDAFSATPDIVPGSQGNYQAWVTSPSTTGFTLNQGTGSAQTLSWVAIGAD